MSVRKILPVLCILALIGAGGTVIWSVVSRPDDSYITQEVANSFNLQTGPAPVRAPLPLAAGETLRDAIAAAPPVPSSLTRPIATEGMAVGGVARRTAAEKPFTVITPKAEAWARKHRLLAGLVARPAAFLMKHSPLSSARDLRAFLANPRKVDAYMDCALVRVTLNSPTVAKALLGNPAVIRAFLAMPAMRDPQAVRALLASPMLHKMLDCPAIQEAMGDPEVMRQLVADPKTVAWIAAHPQAMMAIAQAAPALGDALGSRR